MQRNRFPRAFTLLELLVVVTLLGIIAAIIVARYGGVTDQARRTLNAQHKVSINSLVERYYMDTGSWPSQDLSEMDNDTYFPAGLPVSPYDGVTTYTIDNVYHRVNNVPDP